MSPIFIVRFLTILRTCVLCAFALPNRSTGWESIRAVPLKPPTLSHGHPADFIFSQARDKTAFFYRFPPPLFQKKEEKGGKKRKLCSCLHRPLIDDGESQEVNMSGSIHSQARAFTLMYVCMYMS